jgi:condensin-2 complex subunit D3
MLLALIAPHAPKLDATFVLDYWNDKVTSIQGISSQQFD